MPSGESMMKSYRQQQNTKQVISIIHGNLEKLAASSFWCMFKIPNVNLELMSPLCFSCPEIEKFHQIIFFGKPCSDVLSKYFLA